MAMFKQPRETKALLAVGVALSVGVGGAMLLFAQLNSEGVQSDNNKEVQLGKLSDNLREYLKSKAGDEIVKVWVELTPADLENVEEDRVVDVLKAHADETQRPILEFLEGKNAEVINTFWLGNSILANVAVNTVYELTSFQMIERVYGDFELPPIVVD